MDVRTGPMMHRRSSQESTSPSDLRHPSARGEKGSSLGLLYLYDGLIYHGVAIELSNVGRMHWISTLLYSFPQG